MFSYYLLYYCMGSESVVLYYTNKLSKWEARIDATAERKKEG